jgi:hypothetical protein
MNQLKRKLGLLWMLAGPVAIYYLFRTAMEEIQAKPMIDTKIQWGVFIVVFVPIAIGLMIFGYFCLQGDYDRLPERSSDIEED